MFELSAEKFAKLMKTDVKGLKAFVKKNGKPSELRLKSATQVIRDLNSSFFHVLQIFIRLL